MLSVDTNILFHAFNKNSRDHANAYAWLDSVRNRDDVAISELILAELYRLLRNPVVLTRPLNAEEAVEVVQRYRRPPKWRLIGFPQTSRSLHDELRRVARASSFAYRRLYDTRAALTMTSQGVTEFATVNVKDFEGLGFRRVWNPLEQK